MNLEAETRNGYTISSEMKKVWSLELLITKHILDVCKRHGLGIWAEAGTLLGAVRHKGFIPWDDDIDLMMFRDDYEKLLELANKEFTSPFFLQSVKTEKNYFRGHAQVRLDNTAAILPNEMHMTYHQGIFVDIFVYDDIPDVLDKSWERLIFKAKLIRKSINTATLGGFDKGFFNSVKYLISKAISFIFPLNRQYKYFENLFTQFNNKGYLRVACPTFSLSILNKVIRNKDWYNETVFLPFEDIMLPAPYNYKKILINAFGDDYMIPKQLSSLHGDIIFSTNTSYKEIIKNDSKRNI